MVPLRIPHYRRDGSFDLAKETITKLRPAYSVVITQG
jgi:hypothetical protein